MTLESLETLNDEQLQMIIARAGELIKQHDRERKEKALTDARSILAAAGLSLKTVAARRNAIKAAKTRSASKRARLAASDETGSDVDSQRGKTGLAAGFGSPQQAPS